MATRRLRKSARLMGYDNVEHLNRDELIRLIKGGSVISQGKEIIQRIKGFLTGARKIAPPIVREFLSKYGDGKIVSISVCRDPIQKFIKTFFNVLTFGEFERKIKQYNYDDLYHLYFLITFQLTDGQLRTVLIEKNHVVNITLNYNKKAEECRLIRNIPNNLTLNNFLMNGEKFQGKDFYIWTVGNNCQVFVESLLKGNGIDSNDLNTFVRQCASCILNSKLKNISNTIVDIASRGDILLHGQGRMIRGGKYVHSSPITRAEQEAQLKKPDTKNELIEHGKDTIRLIKAINSGNVYDTTKVVQDLVNKIEPGSGIIVPILTGLTDLITNTRHYEPGQLYELTVDALPLPNSLKDKIKSLLPSVNQEEINRFHQQTRAEYDYRKKYAQYINQTTGKVMSRYTIPAPPPGVLVGDYYGNGVKRTLLRPKGRIGVAVRKGINTHDKILIK
jgi:hypothetical protein